MLVITLKINKGSAAEKESWIRVFDDTQAQYLEYIQRTGDVNHKIQYYAPVWIPDNFSDTCMVCDIQFSFFNRRVSLEC
jgi:hypothetical protein